MQFDEYKEKALRTDFADYSDYHTGDVTPRFEYSAIGLMTESGKVLDLIKKSKKDLVPLDNARVVEELGDLLWYLNLALDELGVSYEELMQSNIEKIGKKYPVDDVEANKLIRG
jgi:NTP pyrophosphatase (non-canonical NTP hydrolase)